MAESYPHWEVDVERHMSRTTARPHRYLDVAERQARRRREPYGSIMCSIPGGVGQADGSTSDGSTNGDRGDADPTSHGRGNGAGASAADVARLGRALDELADAAQAQDAEAEDVAVILNTAWEMVAQLDPELARRLAGYGSTL
jgi:hypothetical protein